MFSSGSNEIINRRFLGNPARLARIVAAGILRPAAELGEPPEEIAPLAQLHARDALDALVGQLRAGVSEASTVAAANALLDRAYGKPVIDVGGTGFLPFFGRAPERNANFALRDLAKRYAPLAIERLVTIAISGTSESAKVSAARSLIDRGHGIASPARIDLDSPQPVGKREQAILAANMPPDLESGWGDDLQPRLH